MLAAQPLGKTWFARALVRTGAGAVPPEAYRPPALRSYPLTVDVLRGAQGSALPQHDPDTIRNIRLAGTMNPYVWTINGRHYDETVPLTIGAARRPTTRAAGWSTATTRITPRRG